MATWLVTAGAARAQLAPADAAPADPHAIHERWPSFLPLPSAPPAEAGKWCDFLLPRAVFAESRSDLGDLRLYRADGVEVPYALRVRAPDFAEHPVAGVEFNRAVDEQQATEVSLDLGEQAIEHNAVEVDAPGVNVRRAAVLHGSDDREQWKLLAEEDLVAFKSGNQELIDRRLSYPPSRFRYLRIRVRPDPQVDRAQPPAVTGVRAMRKVAVPGELVTYSADWSPREPVNAGPGPGSAWTLDLGGDQVPVSSVLVDIADAEFARDFYLQAAGTAWVDPRPEDAAYLDPADTLAYEQPWQYLAQGQWRRTAGEPRKPLLIEFPETRASRIKLIVTDHRNPPLELRGAQVRGAARQIVVARDALAGPGPVRLYFGNRAAFPPHYDVERNLPAELEPPPHRLTPGEREANPRFVPPPLPLTERLPWLIHLVLGAACLVLGGLIFSTGRAALALQPDPAPPAQA